MDLNKTIIMKDTAGGLTVDQTLNKILAETVWGTVTEKGGEYTWRSGHDTPTAKCPNPELVTYNDFVKEQFPYKTEEEEPDEEARNAANQETKTTRNNLLTEFTAHGQPGYRFKNSLDKMSRCLLLPKSVIEEMEVANEEDKEEDYEGSEGNKMNKLFAGGKVFIVPSLFRLLLSLRKSKREYAILFRTFGTDLSECVMEFNSFCEGFHPCYNGKNGTPLARFDGSKGTKDMRINNGNSGYFRRHADNPDDIDLILGTSDKAPEGTPDEEFHAGQIDEGEISVTKGLGSVHIKINETLNRTCSMALNDDYATWDKYGEQSKYGKLLSIDQQDYTTHHVFFDDNTQEEDEKGAIDCRDLITGENIPHARANNRFMVKVDPYKVITDQDYFSKELEACENNWNTEINRIEAGISSDCENEEEEVTVTQWEKFQQAAPEEYLSQAIFPVLIPALEVLDIERPDDPVSFLAMYCLKNKHRVVLPQPSE